MNGICKKCGYSLNVFNGCLKCDAEKVSTEKEMSENYVNTKGAGAMGIMYTQEYVDKLQAQLIEKKQENQSFGNVLAVIHKDGGHYITEHGYKKASEDAIVELTDLQAQLAKHRPLEAELADALENLLACEILQGLDSTDYIECPVCKEGEWYRIGKVKHKENCEIFIAEQALEKYKSK